MLVNKRIVIIGGTDGLGFSTALACIENGAKVLVVGRDLDRVQLANQELAPNGAAIAGDAMEDGIAKMAIETCIKLFGEFDGLYHVAGGSGRKFGDGPLHEISIDGWQQTLDLNLTSLMLSNRAALQYFVKNKRAGVILNMGSVLGFSPSTKYFSTHAYATCKAAIVGLTKSAAAFYAPFNIRVNVIAPGLIETPMSQRAAKNDEILRFVHTKQPLDGGRIGIPSDCDGAAVFLLSDLANFITGQVLAVDGGWTVSEGQN